MSTAEAVTITLFASMFVGVLLVLLLVVTVNWFNHARASQIVVSRPEVHKGRLPMPTAVGPLASTANGHASKNGHPAPTEVVARAGNDQSSVATTSALRSLIVVSRQRPTLYEELKLVFGGRGQTHLIVDRRKRERRSVTVMTSFERRYGDRRQREIDADLRTTGWALLVLLT